VRPGTAGVPLTVGCAQCAEHSHRLGTQEGSLEADPGACALYSGCNRLPPSGPPGHNPRLPLLLRCARRTPGAGEAGV